MKNRVQCLRKKCGSEKKKTRMPWQWGEFWSFCVYDEPSADLCLHKDLHLANVHHRAVKRDDVQSIRIE